MNRFALPRSLILAASLTVFAGCGGSRTPEVVMLDGSTPPSVDCHLDMDSRAALSKFSAVGECQDLAGGVTAWHLGTGDHAITMYTLTGRGGAVFFTGPVFTRNGQRIDPAWNTPTKASGGIAATASSPPPAAPATPLQTASGVSQGIGAPSTTALASPNLPTRIVLPGTPATGEAPKAGTLDLSGLTAEEAQKKIAEYMNQNGAPVMAAASAPAAAPVPASSPSVAPQAAAPTVAVGSAAPAQASPASYVPPPVESVKPVPNARFAMDGHFEGVLPKSIERVDSMAGVTEGDGGPGDTVYVIVDPRCPHCQDAFRDSRRFLAGHTIKWIPALALGDPAGGKMLAATLLQNRKDGRLDAGLLKRLLGDHEQIRTEPTAQTLSDLDRNLAFLYAAFEENSATAPGQTVGIGVPAVFLLDHRSGKPRMFSGLPTTALVDLFGPPQS